MTSRGKMTAASEVAASASTGECGWCDCDQSGQYQAGDIKSFHKIPFCM
jgi:hypothetical protein